MCYNIGMFDVPTYLYHRTTVKAYAQIMSDGKIRHTGTPASNWRFKRLKFGNVFGIGEDKWKCVFLADDPKLTSGLVWAGDIVLKIDTTKLRKSKFDYDENVSIREYGRSYIYKEDIPISEIVSVITDKWSYPRIGK